MIVNYEDLAAVREKHIGEVITYASGCFDILHPGHIEQLKFAKSLGDVAVVGVTPDARIKARKGSERPINPLTARLTVIDALRHVDYCFVTPDRLPDVPIVGHAIMRALKPDFLVTHDTYWHNDEDWLLRQGTRIVSGPSLLQTSTTQIVNTILERYGDSMRAGRVHEAN